MRNTLTLAAILAGALSAGAQDHGTPPFTCHANDLRLVDPALANDPATLARIAETRAELEAFTETFAAEQRGGGTYVIPVVFHIIHYNGTENISDAQVEDAIRILNEDFNKENPDWDNVRPEFLDRVADVGFDFRLARKDPQGNCTKGITRTVSTLTYQGDQDMKDLIQWPRNKYLNVWVGASADGAAGYALYPSSAAWFAAADGIVLQHSYVGSIGTGSPSRSRALTHEVGHWINLAHCWGDSNEPGASSNCNMDDGVSDTPNTQGWTSCNLSGASCGSALDNVENYMEYSYCSKMFTTGQKTRMVAAINSSTAQRNQLWTPTNLTATGVSGTPELCAADFTSSTQAVCAGNTVTYTDVSYHGVTSRTWTFAGGTPSTSSDPTVTVTYDTPGTYQVVLSVSDGSTNLTVTEANHVTVLADPGATVPFNEGFEALSNFNGSSWAVDNPNGNNTFEVTTAAAHSGSKSTRVLNSTAMSGQFDNLISSTYDMSDADQVVVTFRYAYARRNSNSDDRLRLYVSNNCGETWSMRRQLRGASDLNTAGNPTSGSFVPSASQWGYAEVTNISTNYHVSDFRIRFEFESDGGNNVYVDDININGQAVGVEELLAGGTSLVVVPNPAQGAAQAVLDLTTGDRMTLEITDVLGRRITTVHDGRMQAGLQRVDLPIASLTPGLYLLRLQQAARTETVRFVVE